MGSDDDEGSYEDPCLRDRQHTFYREWYSSHQEDTDDIIKYCRRECTIAQDLCNSNNLIKDALAADLQTLMMNFHWPKGSCITIERFETTKAAVAELTISAVQSMTCNFPASFQDLSLLQSTLFTLQQQQIIQLQLVQQLQSQMTVFVREIGVAGLDNAHVSSKRISPETMVGSNLCSQRDDCDGEDDLSYNSERDTVSTEDLTPKTRSLAGWNRREALNLKSEPLSHRDAQNPNHPLYSRYNCLVKNTTAISYDVLSDLEVNILDILENKTQDVLDLASLGLSQTSLSDFSRKKTCRKAETGDTCNHPCRYCGKECNTYLPHDRLNQVHQSENDSNGDKVEDSLHRLMEFPDKIKCHLSPETSVSQWQELCAFPETSKLQKLVENMDHDLEANECAFCHKVLSCKSALQLHYRTHTGERPFKCLVCGQSFTTNGNLKTHMGVHRVKDGDSGFQCPVCHKKFINQAVLEQHMCSHKGEPVDFTIDQISACEIGDSSSQSSDSNFTQHIDVPRLESMKAEKLERKHPKKSKKFQNQMKNVLGVKKSDGSKESSSLILTSSVKSASSFASSPQSPTPSDGDSLFDANQHDSSSSSSFLPLDLRPKGSKFSSLIPLNQLSVNSALTSLTASVLNTTSSFNPAHINVITGHSRGNTTCNICLKTFACHSALEIHYRSHTKERPFKCHVCERGFSTKGNMKQHMLTHKIRDLPTEAFDATRLRNQTEYKSYDEDSKNFKSLVPHGSAEKNLSHPTGGETGTDKIIRECIAKDGGSTTISERGKQEQQDSTADDENSSGNQPFGGSSPKHMCNVCHKSFSSSSSVHIHMRTHTGDKPFKCTVCQKAFTTKGNLKVHMGTHMWTNTVSRRGRRMSLEMPAGFLYNEHGVNRNMLPFLSHHFPGVQTTPTSMGSSQIRDFSFIRPSIPSHQAADERIQSSIERNEVKDSRAQTEENNKVDGEKRLLPKDI